MLKRPKTFGPKCFIAHTPKWSAQLYQKYSPMLTSTNKCSNDNQKLRFHKNGHITWRITNLMCWSIRKCSAHTLWPGISPKWETWRGRIYASCQRVLYDAHLAIFSDAYTNRSTLRMSVGFTATILLQPYPQNGHKEHPKQFCLFRALRTHMVFATCCQALI